MLEREMLRKLSDYYAESINAVLINSGRNIEDLDLLNKLVVGLVGVSKLVKEYNKEAREFARHTNAEVRGTSCPIAPENWD